MSVFSIDDPFCEIKREKCADVVIKKPEWYAICIGKSDVVDHVDRVTSTTLRYIGFFNYASSIKLTVLLDGDDALCELNKEFRSQNKPTNVLSFPSARSSENNLEESENSSSLFLGDIAISYDRVYKESIEQAKNFLEHFTHILVHATLHLVGYDHVHEDDAKRMEKIEVSVLSIFGFKNPYILEHVTDALIAKL